MLHRIAIFENDVRGYVVYTSRISLALYDKDLEFKPYPMLKLKANYAPPDYIEYDGCLGIGEPAYLWRHEANTRLWTECGALDGFNQLETFWKALESHFFRLVKEHGLILERPL